MKKLCVSLACIMLALCLPLGAVASEQPGEYQMVCPYEIHQGAVEYACVECADSADGGQLQWQWESSDPMVLEVSTQSDSTAKLETVKPGKAVITATSNEGHVLEREVEVFSYAIRHGLRLVKEGADLKLERGKEKDLTVVLQADPEALEGVRLMAMGEYDRQNAPFIESSQLQLQPGPEGSGEFTLTIPAGYFDGLSGVYYLCYQGLRPEPVSKLTVVESDSSVLTWVLIGCVAVLMVAVLVIKPHGKKAK